MLGKKINNTDEVAGVFSKKKVAQMAYQGATKMLSSLQKIQPHVTLEPEEEKILN